MNISALCWLPLTSDWRPAPGLLSVAELHHLPIANAESLSLEWPIYSHLHAFH